MEYFFILGRNVELSYAEVLSYLENSGTDYKIVFFKKNFIVVDLKEEFEFDIQNFGGVIKLGRVEFRGSEKDFESFLEEADLIDSNDKIEDKEKFNFSVTGNFLEEMLVKKFKNEGRKAQIKHGRKKLMFQKRDYVLMPNSDIEFFAYSFKDNVYFGTVEQDYSYTEVKERDMKKPIRRESLAISPRLAKILINLSQTREGELLLDPFCGVGGILQEALLKEINCYGVDKDKVAIESAKKNLKWMKSKYEFEADYKLQVGDSKNLKNIKYNGVASEPALGDLVRKKPNDRQAKEIIDKFEKLIISVLSKLKSMKKGDAKIVLTMPFIREHVVNIKNLSKKTGLRVSVLGDVKFPIREFREKSFIGREIVVLE